MLRENKEARVKHRCDVYSSIYKYVSS